VHFLQDAFTPQLVLKGNTANCLQKRFLGMLEGKPKALT